MPTCTSRATPGSRVDHVVHDRGVRLGEALVGVAQIGVRVEVEHAEARVALARAPAIAPNGAE